MFEANMEQNLEWGSQRGGLSKKLVLYLYNFCCNAYSVSCAIKGKYKYFTSIQQFLPHLFMQASTLSFICISLHI